MIVTELQTTNFRLLGTRTFQFNAGATVVFGNNATGKTSMLEAIGYCLRARSVIGAKDLEIPTFGQTCFGSKARLEGEKSLTSSIEWDGRKAVRINDKPVRSSRELVENFKMVAVTPSTSLISTGPPSARREFLDETASQINPTWASTISEYRSVLTERNAWLKSGSGGRDLLEVLTESIITLGTQLRKIREEVASSITEFISEENLSFSCTLRGVLSKAEFSKAFAQEQAREQTVLGPHKDDWALNLNGHQVDRFASTGEARRVTLILKLAQAKLIRQKTNVEPVILADDLFGELDEGRSQDALKQMNQFRQVFITCAQKPPDGEYTLIESDKWASRS